MGRPTSEADQREALRPTPIKRPASWGVSGAPNQKPPALVPLCAVEAVKWYRKAADQGHAEAQYGLGFMYEHGYGIEGSSIPELARTEAFEWHQREEAFKWYQKAADQGNLWAKEILKTDWWQVMQVVLQNRQEVEGETEGVNLDELEGRGIIWYLKGSETPYSGKAFRWGGEYQRHWQWNLRDGKKDGLHVWWHENGKKSSEGNWKDGERDGPFVAWHDNGQKSSEGNWKDGKQDGLYFAWHDNGQKKSEGNWKDGKVIGLSFGWHANGQKRHEGDYKAGKKEGLHASWHENGRKRDEGNYEAGKKEGLHASWHENGHKSSEYNYKDGKQEGLATIWWGSYPHLYGYGQKRGEGHFKNGK